MLREIEMVKKRIEKLPIESDCLQRMAPNPSSNLPLVLQGNDKHRESDCGNNEGLWKKQ